MVRGYGPYSVPHDVPRHDCRHHIEAVERRRRRKVTAHEQLHVAIAANATWRTAMRGSGSVPEPREQLRVTDCPRLFNGLHPARGSDSEVAVKQLQVRGVEHLRDDVIDVALQR